MPHLSLFFKVIKKLNKLFMRHRLTQRIVLIVFAVQDSQSGKNQFGNNPKEIAVL